MKFDRSIQYPYYLWAVENLEAQIAYDFESFHSFGESFDLSEFSDSESIDLTIDSSSDSSSSNNDVEMVFDRPIIIPRGRARFTNQVVTLSESGELKVDGELKCQWNAETMALIKSLKLDISKILVKNNGYLIVNGERLHCLLARTRLQKDFEKFKAEGFSGTIQDLNAVAHLDDDKWNCNIGNLMNMPEAWNYNLKKVKGAKPARKKWICQLVIAESKTFNTKSVSDPDEALVQYGMILLSRKLINILDILKVKHCVEHVKQSPLIAQRLIFQYGLVRPFKFVEKGWYKDINTLISHAGDWTKSKSGRKIGSLEKTKRERFELVSLKDASQPIKDSLNVPGNAPFNPKRDVIFAYIGKKKLADGSILRHERIVTKEFYKKDVLPYEGRVGVDRDGYLMFNSLGMMHNLALGRSRGDFKKDHLEGCHGVGGILDNRVITLDDDTLDPRCLTLGPSTVNTSHINCKKEGSKSEYPGAQPSGQKWTSKIRFDGSDYFLGTFPTEIDAANAYAWVQSSRSIIEKRLAKVPKDADASVKKTLRASNLVIVKSYVKFDANGKPLLHDKVKVIRDRLLANAGPAL